MITFDSPDRTICTSRRIRTNTPLQALNLLNNETYYQAAQALAKDMIKNGNTLEEQLAYGYFKLLYRLPEKSELSILKKLYQQGTANSGQDNDLGLAVIYKQNSKADSFQAAQAMTLEANALLNMDAFIVKK